MRYAIRQTNYPAQDLARNWSSWNYGQEGIKADAETMWEMVQELSADEDGVMYISGWEVRGQDIMQAWMDDSIAELYPGYWVLVDRESGIGGGLCCHDVIFDSLEAAISLVESSKDICGGEGERFDGSTAKLVWSCPKNEYHIFEIQ